MCRDMSIYVVITFFSHLFASLNYVRHCSTSLKKHSRLWDGMERHGMTVTQSRFLVEILHGSWGELANACGVDMS